MDIHGRYAVSSISIIPGTIQNPPDFLSHVRSTYLDRQNNGDTAMNLREICKFYSERKETPICEGDVFCQSCRNWRRQFIDAKENHGFSDIDLMHALQTTIAMEAEKQKIGLEAHDQAKRELQSPDA